MKTLDYDIAVIGGGAAGLTAAYGCASEGMKTVVIDREETPGGVLLQCIHNGFGLHYFNAELTGPEYAARVLKQAEDAGASFLLSSTVMKIEDCGAEKILTVYSRADGVTLVHAKAVILAMGCRERCRGNLGIPGDRAAGIFTAGLAQRLLNVEGCLPGRKAVIVGSGDIGLIMARRLTWCGIEVKAVVEIMPYPSGLSRNIAQCLEDFNIPLYLSTGVTNIHGRDRVESVTVAPLENGLPQMDRAWKIECDTVLFSVGLIPENELAKECGVALNPATNGAWVDGNLMTNVQGIFSCGNVLHVHDLVDFVSEEALRCAACAVKWVRTEKKDPVLQGKTMCGEHLRYVVPNSYVPAGDGHFYMRPKIVASAAELVVRAGERVILRKKLRWVKPAEMIAVNLPAALTADCTAGENLNFELEEVKA